MRDVERSQIQQLERPEPETGLLAHDAVDVRETRDAFARHAQAFGVHAAPGVIHDEARHVFRAHRRVTHAAGEFHQRVAGFSVAAQAVDDFDHAHQRHRVEEVKARDAFRFRAARRDRGDGQRRRVRRQNARVADDRFEFAKESALDLEVLDDRLDDRAAVGERADILRVVDAGKRGVRVRFLQLALGGELVEGVGQIRARGRECLRIRIVETHGQPGERRDLRDAASHRAAADDAQGLDLVFLRTHDAVRLLDVLCVVYRVRQQDDAQSLRSRSSASASVSSFFAKQKRTTPDS